jgi:hypothetical protein
MFRTKISLQIYNEAMKNQGLEKYAIYLRTMILRVRTPLLFT